MFDRPQNPFQSLKLTAECPVCHKKQFPADIKLVEEKTDWQILHVSCRNCRSNILVAVSLNEQGMNLVGVLTDLHSEEAGRLLGEKSVVADDVLAVYEHLQEGNLLEKILL